MPYKEQKIRKITTKDKVEKQHKDKVEKQHEDKVEKQHKDKVEKQHEDKVEKQHEDKVEKQHEDKVVKKHEETTIKIYLYTKFIHGNLVDRYKGGNSNFFRRHILSKRITYTGRCVIVPAPNIKGNEVILPRKISNILCNPKAVLLIRFPTLDFQNITFHKVVSVTDKHTVEIPISITKRNGADFDGDEIEIIALHQLKNKVECQLLLDPEYNYGSLQCGKLSMGQDMKAACRGFLQESDAKIEKILYQYYCINGSKNAFDLFHKLESEICLKMWRDVGAGISVTELKIINEKFSDNVEEFDKQLQAYNFPFTWFMVDNSAFHSLHMYQITKKIGIRKLVYCKTPFTSKELIESNFYLGLNMVDFITHCQASRDSLINSNYGISIEGYNLFKIGFCSKDLVLHYDDSVGTVNKKSKLIALKYEHLFDNPSSKIHQHNFLKHLICNSFCESTCE